MIVIMAKMSNSQRATEYWNTNLVNKYVHIIRDYLSLYSFTKEYRMIIVNLRRAIKAHNLHQRVTWTMKGPMIWLSKQM